MMKSQSLIFAFAVMFFAAGNAFAKSDPNIVYILCDDLGYGDVGIYNPEGKIPTPHMDRLGQEGMIFTDAHSGSAVFTPTRYGILTGRHAWRGRLKGGVLQGYSKHLIEPGRMTIASLLQNLLATAVGPSREATIHHSFNGTIAIRQGKWKLVDAPHSGGWSAPLPRDKKGNQALPQVQLYDLENDPGEMTNLYDQNPKVVVRLQKLLSKYKANDS